MKIKIALSIVVLALSGLVIFQANPQDESKEEDFETILKEVEESPKQLLPTSEDGNWAMIHGGSGHLNYLLYNKKTGVVYRLFYLGSGLPNRNPNDYGFVQLRMFPRGGGVLSQY